MALLAAGIAAGAAVLAAVLGGSLIAQDRETARALERVPPAQRTVTAIYADLGVVRRGETLKTIEPIVRRALTTVMPQAPVRVLQYKLLRRPEVFADPRGVDARQPPERHRRGEDALADLHETEPGNGGDPPTAAEPDDLAPFRGARVGEAPRA